MVVAFHKTRTISLRVEATIGVAIYFKYDVRKPFDPYHLNRILWNKDVDTVCQIITVSADKKELLQLSVTKVFSNAYFCIII